MMAQQQPDEPGLHSQGYIAEKVQLVSNALASALRAVGLRLKTVDDSAADPLGSPTGSSNSAPGASSPKHPILQDLGATVDKALQDAATAEPETRHVLLEAMEEDRLARNNPTHSRLLR